MDLQYLATISKKAQEQSGVHADQFNFGKVYKGVKFEEAIKSRRFKSWITYILTTEDSWNETQCDDMENFREFLDKFCEDEGYPQDNIVQQLEYIEEKEDLKNPPMFKIGKYKDMPLDKVPYDHRVWWVNKTLKQHPATDTEFWQNTPKGRKLFRLVKACDI